MWPSPILPLALRPSSFSSNWLEYWTSYDNWNYESSCDYKKATAEKNIDNLFGVLFFTCSFNAKWARRFEDHYWVDLICLFGYCSAFSLWHIRWANFVRSGTKKKFLNNVNIPTLCFCFFDVSYEMLKASEGLLFGWHFLPLVLHLRLWTFTVNCFICDSFVFYCIITFAFKAKFPHKLTS